MNEFEIKILDFIQQTFSCKFLDYFFIAITSLSNSGIFWIILAVVLLCFKKTRKTGICLGVALILGEVFGNLILKNIFARPRPYVVNADAHVIIKKLSSYSFPSGHARCATESAVAIFANNKKWGTVAIVIAVLTAFSRMYLYMHYPTDVLAGAALGVIDGLLAVFIVKKIGEYNAKRKLGN